MSSSQFKSINSSMLTRICFTVLENDAMFWKSKSHLLAPSHVVNTLCKNRLHTAFAEFLMRCLILRQSGEKIYAMCIIKVTSDQLDLKQISTLDNKAKYKTRLVLWPASRWIHPLTGFPNFSSTNLNSTGSTTELDQCTALVQLKCFFANFYM